MEDHIEPIQMNYGSWETPISSDAVVDAKAGIEELFVSGDNVFWLEQRPKEDGRNAIMMTDFEKFQGVARELGCLNVRSTLYEYGGAPATVEGDMLYFVNSSDQRVYALNIENEESAPFTITPEGYRYSDMIYVNGSLIAVREDHCMQPPVHTIVSIELTTFVQRVLAGGRDFYAAPRVNKRGDKLAYITWSHPNMPWDSTEMWVMDLQAEIHSKICGEEFESIAEPLWSPKGVLYFISDRGSGWWNIHRYYNDKVEKVFEIGAEIGAPCWTLGHSSYCFLDEDKILCSVNFKEGGRLILYDIPRKLQAHIESDYISHECLHLVESNQFLYFLGNSSSKPRSVVRMEISREFLDIGKKVHTQDIITIRAHFQDLRRMYSVPCDSSYISVPQVVEFMTKDLVFSYGFYYEPKNPHYKPPVGELPPVLVKVHGGPTAATSNSFDLEIQYWTTRGFAIFDVNYGGSSGYGRAYRERLYGRWGEVDVQDVCSGVDYLVSMGWVDPARTCIDGGSAGGYTTLACLTFTPTFKAGASMFGVADLEALAQDTHKFEAHYLDNLIGKYPEAKAIYKDRSPINHVDKLNVPLVLFQGDSDKVVPPNQALKMYDAVRLKGLPVSLSIFEHEQHGFVKAKNIKTTLDGEYYFFCKVFGITPVNCNTILDIQNM